MTCRQFKQTADETRLQLFTNVLENTSFREAT